MKEFFTTNKGVLFEGDCLELLSTMKTKSIDCVFADPPFNIGKDYKNGYNDSQSDNEYLIWCEKWISECSRVLKDGGAFYLYATPELNILFGNILNKTLQFRHWIALSMKGTFRRGNRLYPAHYSLLYYTKGEPKTFNNLRTPIPTCRHCNGEIPDYGGHRNKMNPEGVNLTDIWTDTSPNRHSKYKVRPGVNELKLIIPERAVLISTNENDIVFDPFGGGGSTYQTAEKNNRRWIGIELYDSDHIMKRFLEEYPLFVNNKPDFDLSLIFEQELV
jgi:site-specific DNA-methyltransferase (adenine-specific)